MNASQALDSFSPRTVLAATEEAITRESVVALRDRARAMDQPPACYCVALGRVKAEA